MAKGMTSSQIVATIAEKTGLKKADVNIVLDELADLAYSEAHTGFRVPGIGKLVLVDRKARTARNPKTGEEVQVPARKALKFRIAKVCKDAVLNG